jgi:hypothetical protein
MLIIMKPLINGRQLKEDALNAYYECKDKLIELLNENNIEL